MASNKTESAGLPATGADIAAAGWEKTVQNRNLAFKALGLCSLIALVPFAMWLIGSGIVWMTPAVYRSGAILKVAAPSGGPAAIHQESERMKSDDVIGRAAGALAGNGRKAGNDAMDAYILWSSLSISENAGPNLIKVEARSARPEEARRILMAVVEAYQAARGNAADGAPATALVYLDPVGAAPARVSDETRMVLGIAGVASLCLLLCIPFLRYIERAMPLRLKTADLLGQRRLAVTAVPGFGREMAGGI